MATSMPEANKRSTSLPDYLENGNGLATPLLQPLSESAFYHFANSPPPLAFHPITFEKEKKVVALFTKFIPTVRVIKVGSNRSFHIKFAMEIIKSWLFICRL